MRENIPTAASPKSEKASPYKPSSVRIGGPRRDLARINSLQVDFLFAPKFEEIYPDDYNYRISEKLLSQILCGLTRPGHFDGVLTVVLKLFNIVQPTHAYFGEKDFQQLTLLQEMTKAFFLDIQIIPCPTIREIDGLAMSSRNQRLSESGRKLAPHFPKILNSQKNPSEIIQDLASAGFQVDYVEEYKGRRYGAVFIDDERLIDNVKI